MLITASRYQDALELTTRAHASATALGSTSSQAEALLVRGDALRELGEYPRAETDLTAAWHLGLRVGHDRVAAEAATGLMFVVGVDLKQPARGREWGQHADALIAHLGAQRVADLRWRHVRNTALLSQETGAYEDAREAFARAIEMSKETFGPEHPYVGRSLNDLSIALYARGAYEEGLTVSERALALFDSTVGPEHPASANARMTRGGIKLRSGDLDGALRDFESATAAFESALGPDHPQLAIAHNNVAAILNSLGDYEGMLAHARRMLEIVERTASPTDTKLAEALNTVAVALRKQGELQEATALLRRALAIVDSELEEAHPLAANIASNLGVTLASDGQPDEAVTLHRRSLKIFEAVHGPAHPDVAYALGNLASSLLDLGEFASARSHAARALEIQKRALGPENPAIAETHLRLGSSLAGIGELDAAEDQVNRALALLETHPDTARLAYALEQKGELLLARGEPARGVEPLTRAVSLLEKAARAPAVLASARFALARALVASERDRARAVTLARQARDGLSAAGARHHSQLDEIDEWLVRHSPAEHPRR